MSIPPPTDPFEPLVHPWRAGRVMVRCHRGGQAALEFNPTSASRRFRPILDEAGAVVPTIYTAHTVAGAISETVLHDVPVVGPDRRVFARDFEDLQATFLVPSRRLRLARLHGHGFRRLRASRRELIETEADRYPETVPWSQRIFDHSAAFDGVIWRSRQFDDTFALMLWQPRLPGVLRVDTSHAALPLGLGRGRSEVLHACREADITVIEP